MATNTERVKRLWEKYNSQIIKFQEEKVIEFFEPEAWIEFVAIYLSKKYEERLRFLQVTEVEDFVECCELAEQKEREIGKICKAFKVMLEVKYQIYTNRKKKTFLGKLGIRKYDILIDTKKYNEVYNYALNYIESKWDPTKVFNNNVRYRLKFDEEINVYTFSMEMLN